MAITRAQLDAISANQERRMLQAFNSILSDIRSQAVLSEVVRALEVGNVDAVIRLLNLDDATWEPLTESIRESYRQGGVTTAQQIGRIPTDDGFISAQFSMRSVRAEAWVLSASIRMEISLAKKEAIRAFIVSGLADGMNPRSVALDLVGRIDPVSRQRIGGIIGMTDQQMEWIRSARKELENLTPQNATSYLSRQLRDKRLDAAVTRAASGGKPLTAAQIDTAVTRMQNRTLRYRGQNIARTESINALRAGQMESIQQAIQSGEINPGDVLKIWDDTGDSKTREDHTLAGIDYAKGIPIEEPFIVGGELLMYPGDPSGSAGQIINCRCAMRTVIDFGAQLKRIEGFR